MNTSSIKAVPFLACFVAWVVAVIVAFACGCAYAVFLEQGHVSESLLEISKGSRDALQVLLVVGTTSAGVAAIVAAVLIALLAWPLIVLGVKNWGAYTATALCVVFVLVILLTALNHFGRVLPSSEFYFAIVTTVASGLAALMVFRAVVVGARLKN